ncbi:hypothetical protein EST38_g12967 [Candolleomyces aberdarensis]|uniref:Nephrocystin 3-like N-terminal domain-containing protein n=1 Tax=Candolleomyces aberdarensis TaxID=2316362 RepID=A0A4Q2D374_9AGAR|nr:hypothetical protein EST38_g12967 [Candolleomyces aberdarensis]
MADPPLNFENFSGAHDFLVGQQTINVIAGSQYLSNSGVDLIARLNPVPDASHTRDRKTSPPDSACFPGTREGVIKEVITWADAVDLVPETREEEVGTTASALVVYTPIPHVYWLHGFAGCGKSAVSLKIADIFEESGRLLASYFFFRNAGYRSTMKRFAATLASQLASALPATAPFIETALRTDLGLLSNSVSLTRQLERLVFKPFQEAMKEDLLKEALAKRPYIIVIDGLDECDDRREVEEFITCMLAFFDEHPTVPLRMFIASRVEQHIRERLETVGVRLGNLDSHSPLEDIERYLQASFQMAATRDRIIRAYVRVCGSWPTKSDIDRLIKHIRGSFVLASTMFQYIIQPPTQEDPRTPMDRLPLTLEMNGLDGLYAQTLARSQHFPHFHDIISTITVLRHPLPIVWIAGLLDIQAFEVVRVLLNLQAIIHVPGTDVEGKVTMCHTSLRDFLTTESRSGFFFVPPSFHLHLSYYCFFSVFERSERRFRDYDWQYFDAHWRSFVKSTACDFINEIEQFKARQPLLVNRLPYHVFLCSMFFYTLFRPQSRPSIDSSYLLTKCTTHLALAVECPDRRIRFWLEGGLPYNLWDDGFGIAQITEHTYQTLQCDLQGALTAMHANFPEILECQRSSPETKKEFAISRGHCSGIDVFNALTWIVARARFKWEELRMTPPPPLKLLLRVHGTRLILQL